MMISLENDRHSNQILPHVKYNIPVTQYKCHKDMNCIRDGIVLDVKLHIQVKFKENILNEYSIDEKKIEAFNEVFKELGYYFVEYPYYITYLTSNSINYILERNFNKYRFLKGWMTSNIHKNRSNIKVLPPNLYEPYFYNRYLNELDNSTIYKIKDYFEEISMNKSIVYLVYPETTYVKEL